jgi:serine/threonine protein kinase
MNQPHDPDVTAADSPSAPADQLDTGMTAAVDKGADPLDRTEHIDGSGSIVDSHPDARAGADAVDSDPAETREFASTPDATPAVAAPEGQDAGKTWSLGGYRILRALGQGGMGTVYEAEDIKLKRRVALKVMKPEIAKNQDHRDRFVREAKAAAKVESDFICPIYRVGEDNGVPFIAMPFLKGEPLDAHLKKKLRLTVDDVVRIGKEVAQGLSAAHEAGLVHRDIKPANIWLETQRSGPPRAIILDFGLARKQADDVQITQSGAILGTPAFMSPEQARADKNVDARTDLFSLGCVLYVLCTAELPFKGETTMGVLTALATRDPTPPHIISATTPKQLSDVIMRMLAKKPDDRPQTAREVIEELDADSASAVNGDFTAQVEPLQAQAKSANAGEMANSTQEISSVAAPGERLRRAKQSTDDFTEVMSSVAAPKARRRKRSYALRALIAVYLLGGIVALAGGGIYYAFFTGSKVPAPEPETSTEPTGEVPAGWVVFKSPVANYTVAMPQQPQVNGNSSTASGLITQVQPMPANQRAQAGGADKVLDHFMVVMLAQSGAMEPGGQVPEITKLTLGPCLGRECLIRSSQGQGPFIAVRAYLIDNFLVTLTGPATVDAPTPVTAAFFKSLKLGK